jgi:hypothetical protein
VRKATSLQNRENDIRQQQIQQQAITETNFLENSRTKRGDMLDLQELEAVSAHMEMLQAMSESLREQQFQAILELGVELQDILREIKKLHNAYPLPEATPVESVTNTPDCILDTPRKHDGPALQNTRIPQNQREIRKKKKKQISPLSPPQALEPEKTDQTQHLPTNFIRDATASEKTNQTQHFPTSDTLKPRKDISYLIIDADAVKPNPRARITAKYHRNTYHPLIPSGLSTRRLRENWLQHNTRTEIREYIKDLQSHYNLAQQNRQQRAHPSPKHPT